MWPQAERAQLNRQAVGKCCFPGGGGSCHQHDLHVLPVRDVLRDVTDPALLQGLLHQNHVRNVALADLLVQISDRGNVHQISPLRGEHQLLVEIFLLTERRQLTRRLMPRKIQKNSLLVGAHLELTDIVGGWHHISIEIVIVAFQTVHVDRGAPAEMEELHLVLHPLTPEQRDGIIQRIGFLRDLTAAIPHVLHLGLDFLCEILRYQNVAVLRHRKSHCLFLRRQISVNRAEIRIPERKLNLHAKRMLPPRQIRHCLDQHQRRRPHIGKISRGVPCRDHRNHAVPVQLLVQLPHLAVKIDQRNPVPVLWLELTHDFLKGRSLFVLSLLSVYKYCRHVFLPSR